MRKYVKLLFFALLVSSFISMQAEARAGGGGGSSGGGGGSSGGGGAGSDYHGGVGNDSEQGDRNPVSVVFSHGILVFLLFGGTIIFTYRARKAKFKNIRLMKQYEKLGYNWNYKEIQKHVEKAYFEIQECWRRQDVEYAGKYLSRSLKENWNAKIEWMKIRNEEVVQKNVRLFSALPVCAIDEKGMDNYKIWYLIHGRMTGYYRNRDTRMCVRGNPRPESFYEYWLFVHENGSWVLREIRQKDEMDIRQFSG